MNLVQRFSATLAALAISSIGLGYAPLAHAHACNGPGTIKIVEKKLANGKTEYWYFQGGRVCGRFVA
jgi:hypothetical protein